MKYFLLLSMLLSQASFAQISPVTSGGLIEASKLNGESLNRADYPALFLAISTNHGSSSALTFNIPDYRGRFLRGISGTSGLDPDAASRGLMNPGGLSGNNIGSVQADDNKSHSHSMTTYTSPPGSGNNPSGLYQSQSGVAYNTAASGGNEARPKNAYVQYCIKVQ